MSTIECTACASPLPLSDASKDYGAVCASCTSATWATMFPAAFEPPKSAAAEALAEATEASCFYHLTKRANVACDSCGRFLCKLCQMELGGQTLCPSCVEGGRRKRTLTKLDSHRVLYDSIALGVATIPILMIYIVPFTAPAALYIAIRHWKDQASIVPRSRIRLYLAVLFGLAGLGLFVLMVVGLWMARR